MRFARLPVAPMAALLLSMMPSPALAGSGTVSGTLIDDDAGGFAAGMTVSACGPAPCVSADAPSDQRGHYRLALPAGNGWNVSTGDCRPGGYALSHKFGVNVVDD